MDEQTARQISETLSSYIEQRDAMSLRAKGNAFQAGQGFGPGTMDHFSRMTTAHALRLLELLPPMRNLHEMTALSELVNSALAEMRNREEENRS